MAEPIAPPLRKSGVINLAAYHFVRMSGLPELRARLASHCRAGGLKGTILLAPEGINLFVAGEDSAIDGLCQLLRALPGMEGLSLKFSRSGHSPFRRMLVKIKREIIAFGVEGIDPTQKTSPRLAPATLAQWLEEGRPLLLLDTRNRYEVRMGTFRGAKDLGISTFRDFPTAAQALPIECRNLPVVTFCTGGIRCEKAAPYLEQIGFREVYQLDGGILRYFEVCGKAHYEGECFVFDQRVGLDADLSETDSTLCSACQMPLRPEEQAHPRFEPDSHCPHCYDRTSLQTAKILAARETALRERVTPLPGSVPAMNRRPINISRALADRTFSEFLAAAFPHEPAALWRELAASGRLVDKRDEPVSLNRAVKEGERFFRLTPGAVEPPVNAAIQFLHEDEALIVVAKPAPLPMHPAGRFERNTLAHFLGLLYAPEKPRLCHRLDANTTGVICFARTRRYASPVQAQFSEGTVDKRYLVRVHGHPPDDRFTCTQPISLLPGPAGSRGIGGPGALAACTHFQIHYREDDGTTLLEAVPQTGRTNQIRVQLWDLGYPVCGDPTYLPHRILGQTATLATDAPPLCLHAWQLTLAHPITGIRLTFTAPPPSWAETEAPGPIST